MNAVAQDMRQRLKRWPLAQQPSNRSESFLKDARLVNAFAEQDPNTGEYVVQKRVGYTLDYQAAPAGDQGSGIWGFGQTTSGTIKGYSIFSHIGISNNATMYQDGAVFGTAAGLDPLFGQQQYFFVEDQNTPPNRHLIFASNLRVFWTIGTGGWTAAAITALGGANIVGLAYLDQTIYYMDSFGNIYGSAFNDPTTWNALNLVKANAIPGAGVGLAQQLNYIIALKSNSFEVFYDAGNPPPGSPLSPVAGALSNYGCVQGSNQLIDDVLIYATSNRTISPQIVRVDNLQISIISTPAIDRLLDPYQSFNSWTFKHGGHRFYGLTNVTGNFTLAYDIDQKLWYQWTDANGNAWPVSGMSLDGNGQHILQGQGSGAVYLFEGDYKYPTDAGAVVPVDIYTPNADFGTRRRKTLYGMFFSTDQTPGSKLYVSRSDDDYQHFSRPRKVDLSGKFPQLLDEGTFVRRAYHFQHKAPTAFRLRSVDLQMEEGTF